MMNSAFNLHSYDKTVSTYNLDTKSLESCLQVKNAKQLSDFTIIDALRHRLGQNNEIEESKTDGLDKLACSQIRLRSDDLATENAFLREQNFKLTQKLTHNGHDTRKLEANLKKIRSRQNQLETRRAHLLEEVRYLRAIKQTCIIGDRKKEEFEGTYRSPAYIYGKNVGSAGGIQMATPAYEQDFSTQPTLNPGEVLDKMDGLKDRSLELTYINTNHATLNLPLREFDLSAKQLTICSNNHENFVDLFTLRKTANMSKPSGASKKQKGFASLEKISVPN